MKITEFLDRKGSLENQIYATVNSLITEFQEETGVPISCIHIDLVNFHPMARSNVAKVLDVKVSVDL